MKKISTKRGSIALISILLITSILLIVVTGMAEAHMSILFQYNNNVMGMSSYYGAESCLEETIRRLEQDTAFTGTTITDDAVTFCSTAVSGAGNIKTISVTNVENGIYTQQFEGSISITQSGTANNALLTGWKKI
jgi:hypothetical protein